MLMRFRCKNFRSIREEQELSLIGAKTRTDEKSESLIDTPFEDLKFRILSSRHLVKEEGSVSRYRPIWFPEAL